MLATAALLTFGYRLGCVLGDINPLVRWTMVFGSLDWFAVGAFVRGWDAGDSARSS